MDSLHLDFGPQRIWFARLFPSTIDRLSVIVPSRVLCFGYVCLAAAYVNNGDGLPGLPDNDKLLAALARLTLPQWQKLREALLLHGVCRVEDGRWRDADQDTSLAVQQGSSRRAQAGARKRWAPVATKHPNGADHAGA